MCFEALFHDYPALLNIGSLKSDLIGVSGMGLWKKSQDRVKWMSLENTGSWLMNQVFENEWRGRKESTEKVMLELHLENKWDLQIREDRAVYFLMIARTFVVTNQNFCLWFRAHGWSLRFSTLLQSQGWLWLRRPSVGGNPSMWASLVQQWLCYIVIVCTSPPSTWRQRMYFYHKAPVSGIFYTLKWQNRSMHE